MTVEAPWIDQLEERVRQAASEIARLRQENRRLQKAMQDRGAPADGEGPWNGEREEVRLRVEGLVAQLESLLGEEG